MTVNCGDDFMDISRVEKNTKRWDELINFSKSCSWIAGKHLASMMEKDAFTEWESVFAAVLEDKIVGFCTFLKTDYYPENKYSPWISSMFVDEAYRGRRICGEMIERVIAYAKEQGFSRAFIHSDLIVFNEKFGFKKIDELQNYSGDIDSIFAREI